MPAAPEVLEARVAELIENLVNIDRARAGELIALLAQCQASHVARIFHCLPDAAPAAPPPENGEAAQPAKRKGLGRTEQPISHLPLAP
jgi:hypothetical protein